MPPEPARGTQVDLRTCPWDAPRGCKAQGERNCRAWDPSNAREILRHAHARGMPGPRSAKIFGFELDTLGPCQMNASRNLEMLTLREANTNVAPGNHAA